MIIWIVLIILAGLFSFIFLSLIGWVISGYNHLVNGKVNINTQWSNIKTEYQRRADLFYNLVQSVKSHKNFEKETLTEVIKARSGINLNNGTKEKQQKTMKGLDGIFQRLMLVFEQYPRLVSGEHYSKLMNEIRITEDRINVARTDYNDVVRTYNIYVKSFPSNIIAKMFAYEIEKLFENEGYSNNAPKIELE